MRGIQRSMGFWAIAAAAGLGFGLHTWLGAQEEKPAPARPAAKAAAPGAPAAKAARPEGKTVDERATPVEEQQAFLGVAVHELHPGYSSHIKDATQGVMVEDVAPQSPAAQAGIKRHDILVTYEDQKLFFPEQLFALIHADKPGREAKLGVIRGGAIEHLTIALGTRPMEEEYGQEFGEEGEEQGQGQAQGGPGGPGGNRGRMSWLTGPMWEGFEALTLKRIEKDKFHASIVYKSRDGQEKKAEFEGTGHEIANQIRQDKDLTPAERTHLIRALDMGIPMWNFPQAGGGSEFEPGLDF